MREGRAVSPLTDNRRETQRLPALDGLRAIAVCGVVWYHLWQQSWLRHSIRLPECLTDLGFPSALRLELLTRTGYVFVELLLLLSGFCLFLPHARCMVRGGEPPSAPDFYKRRAARIIPSYYLCVLVLFFAFALPEHAYASTGEALRELLANLSFTQILNPVFKATPRITGVLWTAAVEMQFYLFFPLLAYCFRKRPLLTWVGMVSLSMVYIRVYAMAQPDSLWFTLYRLPAYLGIFANGMLSALIYVRVSAKEEARRVRVAATAAFALGVILLISLQLRAAVADSIPVWQASHRFRLSLVFCLLLAAPLSIRPIQSVLGCGVMRFLAAISYNLYIWHQWLFFRFKAWHIPFWEGDMLPNMAYNLVWQRRYTLLMLTLSIALAAVLTYCFERPLSRRLLKR